MNYLKISALVAAVGATLLAHSAQAALPYTAGDLFIGFRATGGTGATKDYLIDIGSASLYTQFNGATFTLNTGVPNIGNIGLDLADTNNGFGADWFTRNQVKWGVFGAELPSDPASTIYAGKRETTFGTQTAPYTTQTSNFQTGTLSNIQTVTNEYKSNGIAAPNSNKATFQNTSNASSYAAVESVNPSFGQFTTSQFEGTLTSTTNVGKALDLFQLPPDAAAAGNVPATYAGRFLLAGDGTITFTAAVPEPTTFASLAMGAGLLGFIRRRNKA